jgi:DNA-binding NarL/FixJ family response regulator
MIRLVVVDDQSVVREALAVMLDLDLDMDVVATAVNGAQALAVAATVRPDVILIDLTMPVLDGLDAIRRIHRDHPEIKILVLTTFASDDSIRAAIEAGASGYLTKDADRATILRAIRAAAQGLIGRTVSSTLASRTLATTEIPVLPPASNVPRTPSPGRA